MAISGSGTLSLNEFHIEAGGTSGTTCSINDSDIRGLIDKTSVWCKCIHRLGSDWWF